jgi:hypothetical protein
MPKGKTASGVTMRARSVLILDATINFALGALLLFYSPTLAGTLGLPLAGSNFYPNILGAVLIGIAIALLIGACRRDETRHAGLGASGAIAINLCGSSALALWLIFGSLELPARGLIILWSLLAILILVSATELTLGIRKK